MGHTAPKGPRQGQRRREAFGAGESNAFGYIHEEDEKSFSVVDSGRALAAGKKAGAPSLRGGAGRGGRGGARGGAQVGGRGGAAGVRGRGGYTARGGRGGGRFGEYRQVG